MMERRNHYAVDAVILFVAAITDRSPTFVERCDSIRMNVLYTEVTNEVLSDQRGGGWMEDELMRLCSGI